ncbi:unnamed protein product [Protopolystoma xenopodis]|uniref:Cadherin domain-containing protein n=1 Tax=Protopolystoma xenopodis TaxID=117903 RepID=A0A3S5CP56_9PLAT|nr:unnamed protein product [Protopolystoma xenopodis]
MATRCFTKDSGTPPKRSSAQVHISISDENDHSPIFIYPPPPTGSVGLLRGAQPVGGAGLGASGGLGEYAIVDRVNVTCSQLGSQIIVRVLANDSDIGRNGEVVYSLARSNQETESADSTRLAAGTNWAVSADPAKNISGTLVTRTDVLAADYTFG